MFGWCGGVERGGKPGGSLLDCSLTAFVELLLNLAWIAMALTAFSALLRRRCTAPRLSGVSYSKALLALTCVLVLLFPFVSASDDLHPTQAVLEDATKRVQQAIAPIQHVETGSFTAMLPALFVIYLMFALVALRAWRPIATEARLISSEQTPHDGRSPPPSC